MSATFTRAVEQSSQSSGKRRIPGASTSACKEPKRRSPEGPERYDTDLFRHAPDESAGELVFGELEDGRRILRCQVPF
jgi:hypothetical protein